MYFVRTPQITPTTTLNIVYQFVLIIDRECVLCAVETEILNINFDKFQYTTPYHGSGGLFTCVSNARARIRSGVNPCGIYGGQRATGKGFSKSTTIFPVGIIQTMFYTLLPFNNAVTFRTAGTKLGNLQQRSVVSVTGQQGAQMDLLTISGLQRV